MTLSVAVQMDPVEAIDIDADTTFVLALEAQERGHVVYFYLPRDLVFREGKLQAYARPDASAPATTATMSPWAMWR